MDDSNINYIINKLIYDKNFYESDLCDEYSPLEDSVKNFCDINIQNHIENNEIQVAFNLLKELIEALNNIEYDTDFDNIYRPVELITYYLAKLLTLSNQSTKNNIYTWIYNFTNENTESYITKEYFSVFMEGHLIYHADEYYTDYDDYERVLLQYNK